MNNSKDAKFKECEFSVFLVAVLNDNDLIALYFDHFLECSRKTFRK
jgi:hypothetical protein